MKYRLPIAALSLIFVTGISCTYLKVRVLNADVLTTELRAWFVQNPEDRPYPPVIRVTRYDRALVAGPLGDVLVPHAREVVYPLVSEPRMPFDALIQRLRHFPRAECHAKLFSVVHSYGFMTFHFMYEIVPKIAEGIALLRADPEVKLLVWKNDTTWIQTLFDIPVHRIVQYDHHTVYHADELFVPSPGHTGYTNPELVRALLAHLPARVENDSPYVLYASRGSSSDRRVSNEHELIEALRHAAPYPLVVFTGRETPTQIVALFRGAAAVVGFHGAGLVNAMFCAPGTPLIEMMFTFEPHWDFMQLSRALGMRYWLVPVPQSWWMQLLVTAPVGQANLTCRICPLNTFAAADAARCVPCPSGTGTVLHGGRSAEDCVDVVRAISYRTELNGIINIVLKMTPRSSPPPDTRLALTEWEWTVFGSDSSSAQTLPSTNHDWRSLISETQCDSDDPYIPRCYASRLTIAFIGIDYSILETDPKALRVFNDSVRAEIAKSLDVPNELVSITGIRPGSVVVDVTVRYANEPPATENIVFQETFKNTWGVTEVSVSPVPEPPPPIITDAPTPQMPSEDGSGGSSSIALGVGLGVGLGTILIATIVVILILRRKRRIAAAAAAATSND
eukprot:gene31014-biopygen5619